MSSALDTVAAWPVGSAADKALQRTAVTKRFIWVFSDTEDTQNFTVVDPADGTLPLYIQWKGILFQYDSTDTTTAHDGTTCAVTADAKRYKAVAAIPTPYAVLSTTTTAQPASPTLGDTYYIPTAATGADWAGKDGQIGVYLARGWVFQAVRIGQFVYDESTDTYYHKTSGGTLTAGFGSQALTTGSVLPSAMSGGGAKVRWIIENQTTNAPPVSPTANVEYIVGSSPTGAWAGKAAQIARYESGAWVYYVPTNGWKAYDKAQNADIVFNGSSWNKASGEFKIKFTQFLSTGNFVHDANCFGVKVYLIGGGGGGGGSSPGGSGGPTTFGTHLTAEGGHAGDVAAAGAAGGLTTGMEDFGSAAGSGTSGGHSGGPFGSAASPGRNLGRGGNGSGGDGAGAGGSGAGWVDVADLSATEPVTIGIGGTSPVGGNGTTGGAFIEEYIRV